MPDESTTRWPRRFEYRRRVLDQLGVHGLVPLPDTPPARLREALSDLYRHEIRQARARLLAGQIERRHYAGTIIELRKRYWLLSVPAQLWLADAPPGTEDTTANRDGQEDAEGEVA